MFITRFGLVIVSLGLASGCSAELHEEHLSIEEPVVALDVDLGSGDVKIVGADVSEVTVTAKIEGPSNHLGHTLSDGRLTLFDDCNVDQCSVNVTVTIPAAIPVEVHTGSGDVRADGLRDEVILETGSGDVSGGDVLGLNLDVSTGSGDVDFRVVSSAERVMIETGSGDVALVVPRGGYRLNVSTGSGDEDVDGVNNDAQAEGVIEVDTGSGDVRVRGR